MVVSSPLSLSLLSVAPSLAPLSTPLFYGSLCLSLSGPHRPPTSLPPAFVITRSTLCLVVRVGDQEGAREIDARDIGLGMRMLNPLPSTSPPFVLPSPSLADVPSSRCLLVDHPLHPLFLPQHYNPPFSV